MAWSTQSNNTVFRVSMLWLWPLKFVLLFLSMWDVLLYANVCLIMATDWASVLPLASLRLWQLNCRVFKATGSNCACVWTACPCLPDLLVLCIYISHDYCNGLLGLELCLDNVTVRWTTCNSFSYLFPWHTLTFIAPLRSPPFLLFIINYYYLSSI